MSQPAYRYPQPSYQAPKKSGLPVWALALILFLVITVPGIAIVAVISLTSASNQPLQVGGAVSTPAATATSLPTYTGSNASTSIECQIQYLNSIGDFSAGNDNKFIVANLVITNLSKETTTVNPANFYLITAAGENLSFHDSSFGLKPRLDEAKVSPGGKVSGGISFKAQKAVVASSLLYQSTFDGGQVLIALHK